MTTETVVPTVAAPEAPRGDSGAMSRPRGRVAVTIMAVLSLIWIFPLFWAVLNSFRDYGYTQRNGYVSFGGWTFDNYRTVWEKPNLGHYFVNSLIITVPAVFITLFLSSMVAFVLARFSYRFNLTLLASSWPPTCCLRKRCSSRSSGSTGRSRCRRP